jgi:hypothetical protein
MLMRIAFELVAIGVGEGELELQGPVSSAKDLVK